MSCRQKQQKTKMNNNSNDSIDFKIKSFLVKMIIFYK